MITGSFNLTKTEEMHDWAARVAQQIAGSTILLLEGELGAGKTTFVQELARALGVEEGVTSPTFTIVSEYDIKHHEQLTKLIHADLYRLVAGEAASEPAIQEIWERAGEAGRVTVIEWADRLVVTASEEGAGQEVNMSAWLRKAKLDDIWRIKFAHGNNLEERTVVIESV